uniref:Maf-like protein n=1 Tax=Panagrolaimus sp. JU765 TaxID=591449 RepID=A0AC34PXT0_9BILA
MKSTWFLTIEDQVKDAKIVLASQSPNRLALLKEIGLEPLVVVSGFDENLSKDLSPVEFVEETAVGKALQVSDLLKQNKTEFDVIIACDTVVVVDDEIIGKPEDADDAMRILQKLNNRWHSVFTGVVLVDKNQRMDKFSVETKVKFGNIPNEMFREYIKTGECMNRAGAYGIQHKAAVFVEAIDGCFFNIVGVPLFEVVKRMRKLLLFPK